MAMTDEELEIYCEWKKKYYTQPDQMLALEDSANALCRVTEWNIDWRVVLIFTFELLCFTLHTDKGREIYIQLLEHIAPYFPETADKYWTVYDNQEKIKNRYRQVPEI